MKVLGLVTEYNPFHNGHKYHIEEAKRLTGADYVIAVMSGNFVQRGTPAMIDKYSRTAMALQNGVDVVFELPVCYATGSAEFFAHGAVSLLDALGIVDYLCFGSECGDIKPLDKAAQFLLDTPSTFEENLKEFVKEGLTYPAARLKALKLFTEDKTTEDTQILTQILTQPNNILGIEYIKAIHNLSSTIQPVTIKRISAHYHDSELSTTSQGEPASFIGQGASSSEPASFIGQGASLSEPASFIGQGASLSEPASFIGQGASSSGPASFMDQKASHQGRDIPLISSATAIRRAIDKRHNDLKEDFQALCQSVPSGVLQILTGNYHITYPVTEEHFAPMLRYKLLYEDSQMLSEYMDITRELADRMKKLSNLQKPISELAKEIKTRNMTLTRINRALIHLLLNIKAQDLREFNSNGYSQYARVLGMKKEASQLLRQAKKAGRIPILTKLATADTQLDALGMRMLSQDILATHLYNQAVFDQYSYIIANEYKHGIVIL